MASSDENDREDPPKDQASSDGGRRVSRHLVSASRSKAPIRTINLRGQAVLDDTRHRDRILVCARSGNRANRTTHSPIRWKPDSLLTAGYYSESTSTAAKTWPQHPLGFVYTPLNPSLREIRLLHLCGARDEGPVKCQIFTSRLDDANSSSYSTVSYHWGSENSYESILVDGKPLKIPTNAERALRCLRKDHAIIWIDSVCINQLDRPERSHQVAMMHDIYKNSHQNLVWLGDDDGTVQDALTTLNALVHEFNAETNNGGTFRKTVRDRSQRVQYSDSGISFVFDPTPILKLFERLWFRRLWVVQEVSLSPSSTCYCGQYTFDLVNLLRAAQWLYYKQRHLDFTTQHWEMFNNGLVQASNLCNFVDKTGFFHQKMTKNVLYSLLGNLDQFECTDSRDRIYGLLGLYQHIVEGKLLPLLLRSDYSKDLYAVFRDATRHIINEAPRDSLSVLMRVSHRPSNVFIRPWPSWVPRWHERWDERHDEQRLANFFRADAGLELPSFSAFPAYHPNTISVAGIYLDDELTASVEAVSDICADHAHQGDFIDNAFSMIRNHPIAAANTRLPEDLALTLLGGRNFDDRPVTVDDVDEFQKLQQYRAKFGRLPSSTSTLVAENDSCETFAAARFDDSCYKACNRRRFFITRGGRIGIGPQTMSVGDSVVVLAGGECPFVISRVMEQYHRLVGHCYVHGIMFGEAVAEHKDVGDEMHTFNIM